MNKAYSRINWENYPSDGTPINETNLNKVDVAVDEIDNRVIALDTTKLSATDAATMIVGVSFNESTGTFTFTQKNGATVKIDTKLEKLVMNWEYDSSTQQLILTLDDGTVQKIDLSALITQFEFLDSDTIAFDTDSAGNVTAIVKDGSITENKLEPNYLANIKVEAAKAETASTSAESYAKTSQSYAVGGTGTRENEDVDNSKYFYQQVKQISGGLSGALIPMGTITFAELQSQTKQAGYMYNIKDAFTTDDTFKEGVGFTYPEGTNVYYTADGYWDCFAGTMTPEGIGALATDGDSANNTVTFESADESAPAAWSDVELLKTGEKHKSIFAKLSTMFKNVRYLYKVLGSTDISSIGDGTATGAISTLKTNLDAKAGTAAATTSANGLMSSTDKTKLNGIAEGANKYTLPNATASVLGGIKVGSGLNVASGLLSVNQPIVLTTQITCNCAAGEAQTGTTTPTAKSGYTPIGVVGQVFSGAASNGQSVFNAYVNGSGTIVWGFRNNANSVAFTGTLTFYCLYVPSA